MLVRAYLAGDRDAFSIIVDDHYNALKSQARRLLASGAQPEDAVQETFERALRGIHRFGLSGDYRLGAWLSRILTNVCYDLRARSSREVRLAREAVVELRPEADVADGVSDPWIVQTVQEALASLPDTHRQALMLREVGGLAYAEVAESENISVENARARVSRAKSSLQHRLAGVKSAGGLLAGLPLVRLVTRSSRWAHEPVGDGRALSVSDGLAQAPGGGSGGFSALWDRIASQISSSPLGQAAMAIVANTPRGTALVGMAATVATVSISAAVIHSPAALSNVPSSHISLDAHDAGLSSTEGPSTASGAATTGPAASAGQYAWVDPGTASTQALAGLPAGSCTSANGVAAPGAGFDPGTPLDMSNAVSLVDAPAVDLATTGQAVSFTSSTLLSSFGSPQSAVSATLDVDACLSSNGWLTATVTVPGGSEVALQGVLTTVLGTSGDLGYIFRGTVTPTGGGSEGALLSATQFVAQLQVVEPDNTAQLTVVLLSDQAASSGAPAGETTPNGTTTPAADATTAPVTEASFSGGASAIEDVAAMTSAIAVGVDLPAIPAMPALPASSISSSLAAGLGGLAPSGVPTVSGVG